MKEITIGQKFTQKVPNSRQATVKGVNEDYPATCRIKNYTNYPDPQVKVLPGGLLSIWFAPSIPVTTKLELVIEQSLPKEPEKVYEPETKGVKSLQFRRGEILKSQESLYPVFNITKALTFDQSYFTRTIGQAKIAADFEAKNGLIYKGFGLISGAGFGAIQAAACALGFLATDVLDFCVSDLRKALKKGLIKKLGQVAVEGAIGYKFDRMGTKGVEKCLQAFFRRSGTKNDLRMTDAKAELFIPVMDINGRALAITKKSFPALTIYEAVCMTLFDPLWFDAKPLIKGYSVLTGDIYKTNDIMLARNNKFAITSIGSPVRYYDHGFHKITREALSLRLNDQKHALELSLAESIQNRQRYQCKPMDEVKQFDFSDMGVEKAIQSGRGVV